MTSRARRRTQAVDVKRRAKEAPQDPGEFCLVPSCRRLTQRADQRGLSINYCRTHTEHIRAHGHSTAKSFDRATLLPYRRAAGRWLKDHADRRDVRQAIVELEWLLAKSGRSESATYMRSRPPKEKCRIQLAKIRDAGKTGGQLLEIVLTSLAAVAEKGPPGSPAFRFMQTAKLAKRLTGASGTHFPGNTVWPPSSRYPRAQGAYMRMLGEKLEDTVRPLLDSGAVEEVGAIAHAGKRA